jgi:hypothetical protein
MDPYAYTDRDLTLQRLKIGLQRSVADQQIRVAVRNDDYSFIAERAAVELSREVYAEQLPAQQITVTLTDPRWATWWDHLKATGKGAWWGRWWIKALRPPRTVDTYVTGTVKVLCHWTYPDSRFLVEGLGNPVLKSRTTYFDGHPR